MIIPKIILASNPFFDAYWESDLLGKLIFLSLIGLSICTWALIIYKYILTRRVREESIKFKKIFNGNRKNPLAIELTSPPTNFSPFCDIYLVLKKHTLEILNKNRRHHRDQETCYLSPTDIDFVESHLGTTISESVKKLEEHLYILSTIVTLAPFLGLLGTVWGILGSFSEMQTHTSGNTNQMVLSGLALALTTTVLGLIDAIPALIGNNYFRNSIRDYQTDMIGFSNDILASVELQYRQVDVR